MPLSYEDRIELLKKAREAKKAKQMATKVIPPSQSVNEDSESSEDFEEPKTKTKTKIPNPKWLKVPEVPKKVKDVEILSKEEYVIDDDKPVKPVKAKAVRAKKAVAKPPSPEPEPEPIPEPKKRATRKVREPVRTLDIIAEPKPIEELMEEVVNNDVKYKPKPRAKSVPKSNSITITKSAIPFSLFDY